MDFLRANVMLSDPGTAHFLNKAHTKIHSDLANHSSHITIPPPVEGTDVNDVIRSLLMHIAAYGQQQVPEDADTLTIDPTKATGEQMGFVLGLVKSALEANIDAEFTFKVSAETILQLIQSLQITSREEGGFSIGMAASAA